MKVEELNIGKIVKYSKTGQPAKIISIIRLSGSYYLETEGLTDAFLDGVFPIEDFEVYE